MPINEREKPAVKGKDAERFVEKALRNQKKIKKKKVAKLEKTQELLDVSHIPGLKVIPIKTRRFVEFNWDFTNSDEVDIPVIKPEQVEDAIVKVLIRVRQEDAHKIDVKKIADKILPHAYLLKPIVPSIQRQRKVRNKKINAEIQPLDAVKLWLEDKNIKDKEAIYKIAEEIIREVGIGE